MGTTNGLYSSQVEHQPRHYHQHHQHQHHRLSSDYFPRGSHKSTSGQQQLSSPSAHPLPSPVTTPQHHQLSSRMQVFRQALDEDRAARATSDGGLGTTPAEAASAPTAAQATSPADAWPRRQQLLSGTSIYTPPHHALRKQTLPSMHQHHHSRSDPSSHGHAFTTSAASTTRTVLRSNDSSFQQQQFAQKAPGQLWQQPQAHLPKAPALQQLPVSSHQDRNAHRDSPYCFSNDFSNKFSNKLSNRNSIVAMDRPPSPASPSTAETGCSSSPGDSIPKALPSPPIQDQLATPSQSTSSQLCESSEPTSSPQSKELSTGCDRDSDSLPTTSPSYQAKTPSRQEIHQAVPTTPFRFPGSRRNNSLNSSLHGSSSSSSSNALATALVQQPQKQIHTAVEPINSPGSFLAYCFDRGNGLYTRLVPADTLPPSAGYSALQSGCHGMIVLQDPLTQPTSGYGARLMQQVRPVLSENNEGGKPFCHQHMLTCPLFPFDGFLCSKLLVMFRPPRRAPFNVLARAVSMQVSTILGPPPKGTRCTVTSGCTRASAPLHSRGASSSTRCPTTAASSVRLASSTGTPTGTRSNRHKNRRQLLWTPQPPSYSLSLHPLRNSSRINIRHPPRL